MFAELFDIISTLALALLFFVAIVILSVLATIAGYVTLALLAAFAFWFAVGIAIAIAAVLFAASRRRPQQFFFPLADDLRSADRRRPDITPPSRCPRPAGVTLHGKAHA